MATAAINPVFIQILEFALELLKNCPEPEKKKIGFIRNLSSTHRVLLFLKARKAGIKLKDFNAGMAEIDKMRATATDADLAAFVRSAA